MNDSKIIWLKVNLQDLVKQENLKDLENALHLKWDMGLYCSTGQINRTKWCKTTNITKNWKYPLTKLIVPDVHKRIQQWLKTNINN